MKRLEYIIGSIAIRFNSIANKKTFDGDDNLVYDDYRKTLTRYRSSFDEIDNLILK